MNWYYTLAGQTYGPLSEADLDALVQTGTLPPTTLVWQKGMANWLSWTEARGAASAAPAPAPAAGLRVAGSSLRVQSEPQPEAPPVIEQAACSQCGGIFPKDQVSEFGGVAVCAQCRPALIQRVQAGGGVTPGAMHYAGFWIRFAAAFVDGIVLNILHVVIGFANGLNMQQMFNRNPNTPPSAAELRALLITLAVFIIYDVVCTGRMGGTPGKRAFGLRVVTADGVPVSYLRAFGRFFAKALSFMTCCIGYIIAGFDKEKRALHDMVCSTRVIKE